MKSTNESKKKINTNRLLLNINHNVMYRIEIIQILNYTIVMK